MTPYSRRFGYSSFRRSCTALPCAVQSGRQITWWTPCPRGRARGELVAAGAAAVKQDYVVVLGACAAQRRPDRVSIASVWPGRWGTR